MLTGPDISHHQGIVDMAAIASVHDVVIMKATEGTSFVDSKFFQNRANALNNNRRIGAYHFLRQGDGVAQAKHFLSVVGINNYTVYVLDCETSASGTNPSFETIRQFCNEVIRQAGREPVIYTYNHWWDANIGDLAVPCSYLWIARYRDKSLGYGPTPPGDYKVFGWQYTSSGSCPGVSGNCDLNDFYVTHEDWDRIAGDETEDIVDKTQEDRIVSRIVNTLKYDLRLVVTDNANRVIHFVDDDGNETKAFLTAVIEETHPEETPSEPA
jgi:GH25 family lysozyme M1 (1,4-beta-N-acetylmuramidase)